MRINWKEKTTEEVKFALKGINEIQMELYENKGYDPDSELIVVLESIYKDGMDELLNRKEAS